MSYQISFHRQIKFDYWKKKLESLSLGLDISEDKTFFFFCMTYDDHFIIVQLDWACNIENTWAYDFVCRWTVYTLKVCFKLILCCLCLKKIVLDTVVTSFTYLICFFKEVNMVLKWSCPSSLLDSLISSIHLFAGDYKLRKLKY